MVKKSQKWIKRAIPWALDPEDNGGRVIGLLLSSTAVLLVLVVAPLETVILAAAGADVLAGIFVGGTFIVAAAFGGFALLAAKRINTLQVDDGKRSVKASNTDEGAARPATTGALSDQQARINPSDALLVVDKGLARVDSDLDKDLTQTSGPAIGEISLSQ